jgi:magnesium-transporting ATPase (P-type)
VGLAVASVPEGLPFLVSAAQLAAARRLSRQGALVRNARTIEALGRVDVLCFDKTGTLTQGRIRLAEVSDGRYHRRTDDLNAGLRAVVAAGLRATPQAEPGQPLDHLTDRSIVDGAGELGVTRQRDRPGWRPAAALAFDPSRGYHATVASTEDGDLLSVKGAPETVLPRCHYSTGGEPLTAAVRRSLRAELDRLTGHGYRVLAVAERRAGQHDLDDHHVKDLRFVGYLALADPVRSTAGPSLKHLQEAGAQIMMITGDHPNTAASIAEELGILNGRRIVTGTELDNLDDAALDVLLPEVAVVARGTPAHKVRVVQAFQRLNRVVAMTGDGANDAPAIRLADVGIALGRRGTPAARAAADLVVTDDRLETIISALVEGRAMWKSVRQALAILVGGNLGEIGFTVFGAAVSGTSPLNARQLLLVNLLTDLAPAMAIALRRPEAASPDRLLAEGPHTSLGAALTREVSLRAVATGVGAAGGWLLARATGRPARARTVALAALVTSQLGQTLLLGGRSPAVLAAGLGSAVVLVAVVQTPVLSQFFGCTPLGPVGWSIAAGAATAASVGSIVVPPLVSRVLPAVTPR